MYIGDGDFVDRGVTSAARYEINFGRLSNGGERQFAIKSMPADRFVFGLRVKPVTGTSSEASPEDVVILLEVVDNSSKVAFRRREPLSRWTKSENALDSLLFFYLREPNGTYLTPQRGEGYSVRVSVNGTLRGIDYIELVAMGGGWK